MKHTLWWKMLLISAVLALLTQVAPAQRPGKTAPTGPKYDAASEVKIKGAIEEIRDVAGDFQGTNLVVKTDTSTVLVYVGPTAFLKEIDTSFNKGDQVEIIGAKVTENGQEELLAREVTVGTNTFTLRDDKGIPVWAGWKMAGK